MTTLWRVITACMLILTIGCNSPAVDEVLETALTDNVDNPVTSLMVHIDRPGHESLEVAVGTVSLGGESAAVSSQYRIASITKTFVATVIMQMVEEQKLRLDHRIVDRLQSDSTLRVSDMMMDGESAYMNQVTILHLLQHRSGLSDIFTDRQSEFFELISEDSQHQFSGEEMLNMYFELGLENEPRFAPGENWHYSDMNYVLLGLLIEKAEGKTLAEVIRSRIIQPLNLTSTYFEFYEEANDQPQRLTQYAGPTDMTAMNSSFDWAGGGLVSNMQDQSVFIRALFELKLVNLSSLEAMTSTIPTPSQQDEYGLGLYLSYFAGHEFFGHYGFYGSYVGYAPEIDMTLVFNCNQAYPEFHPGSMMNRSVQTHLMDY